MHLLDSPTHKIVNFLLILSTNHLNIAQKNRKFNKLSTFSPNSIILIEYKFTNFYYICSRITLDSQKG